MVITFCVQKLETLANLNIGKFFRIFRVKCRQTVPHEARKSSALLKLFCKMFPFWAHLLFKGSGNQQLFRNTAFASFVRRPNYAIYRSGVPLNDRLLFRLAAFTDFTATGSQSEIDRR